MSETKPAGLGSIVVTDDGVMVVTRAFNDGFIDARLKDREGNNIYAYGPDDWKFAFPCVECGFDSEWNNEVNYEKMNKLCDECADKAHYEDYSYTDFGNE